MLSILIKKRTNVRKKTGVKFWTWDVYYIIAIRLYHNIIRLIRLAAVQCGCTVHRIAATSVYWRLFLLLFTRRHWTARQLTLILLSCFHDAMSWPAVLYVLPHLSPLQLEFLRARSIRTVVCCLYRGGFSTDRSFVNAYGIYICVYTLCFKKLYPLYFSITLSVMSRFW